MKTYPDFTKLLNQHLAEKDRSGAWLAQRLELDASTVARWRNGDGRPKDPETVIRIADVLSLTRADRQALLVATDYAFVEAPAAPFTRTIPIASR